MAIDWFEPNDDGTVIAVGLSEGGTEDSQLRLLDVATATLGPLAIGGTRAASVAWQADGQGFWYTRFPDGDQYHRHVRHHALGTDSADDRGRVRSPAQRRGVARRADVARRRASVGAGAGRLEPRRRPSVARAQRRVAHRGGRCIESHSSFRFQGSRLLGTTTIDAPGGRVVEVPLATPSPDHWRTLVPERPDVVLSLPVLVDDELLLPVSVGAVDSLERWSLDGRLLGTIDGLGVVSIAGLTTDRSSGRVFLTLSSFEAPTTVWRLADGELARWCPAAPSADALAPLVVTRTSYPSLDGTEIGLFVIHRADVTPGPDVPLVLNGYGGFAISESPGWMPNLAAWCAEGGVWAIAGLRGGYEHGQAWHDAGRRANKQSVFDDFHSAGDWLVAQGMASHDRLAVVGGSNGGLLVGAALTQRPDLARAVWCAVPLLDMVRYPQFLIARLWTDEYGDPDVPEEFGWLYAYSPYHRVERGVWYPSVLFTTAEGDTRVDPLHARKMAALLQSVNTDPTGHPVYLLQAGRAGHGVGKPASMRVAEGVDVLSFLAGELRLHP